MPANEPYRRFDENGNWQPPPARAGFYKQNPQYANARLQNPKNDPDGPYTEAGLALQAWEKSQGRLQTDTSGLKKRGRRGSGSLRERNRQAQQSTVTATQAGQANSSQSVMAKGPGPAMADENVTRSDRMARSGKMQHRFRKAGERMQPGFGRSIGQPESTMATADYIVEEPRRKKIKQPGYRPPAGKKPSLSGRTIMRPNPPRDRYFYQGPPIVKY